MWNKASFLAFALLVATVLCYRVDTEVGIYGGDFVKNIKEVPFMASIWSENIFICGGSVIHPQFVLTAAHCMENEDIDDISVGLNTIALETDEFDVTDIYEHKNYDNYTLDYDIALLKLSEATSLRNVIKVADQNTLLHDGEMLDIYGWGETINLKDIKYLRHVSIPVYNIDKCKKLGLYFNETISSRMFCAGTFLENRDSCQGDSGGPLLKGNVQVGVVSFGWDCGIFPGVNTRLSAFTTWINDTIEEYKDSSSEEYL